MKKIDFVTLSRSDFATIEPIFDYFLEREKYKVELIAGGSHLIERYGKSITYIKNKYGPKIKTLDFLNNNDDSFTDLLRAFSKEITSIEKQISKSKPDFIFIVGDRWEILPVAVSSFFLKIPLVHHSGGDITQGSFDNQIRYAVSNLANIHLVAHSEHEERLIKHGEEKSRIKVVGEPALLKVHDNNNFIKKYKNFNLKEDFALLTIHPSHLEKLSISDQVDTVIESLIDLRLKLVITGPNPDADSEIIFKKLKYFSKKSKNIFFFENLGSNYYSFLKEAKILIGNSSSGIWESSSFKIPTINIGSRQEGRIRSKNVIDVDYDVSEIKKAISKGLSPKFRQSIKYIKNPYFKKNSLELIENKILEFQSRDQIIKKTIFK